MVEKPLRHRAAETKPTEAALQSASPKALPPWSFPVWRALGCPESRISRRELFAYLGHFGADDVEIAFRAGIRLARNLLHALKVFLAFGIAQRLGSGEEVTASILGGPVARLATLSACADKPGARARDRNTSPSRSQLAFMRDTSRAIQGAYCRSAEPENYRDHDEILSWNQLDRLARKIGRSEVWLRSRGVPPPGEKGTN